jgi:hypothetical protein
MADAIGALVCRAAACDVNLGIHGLAGGHPESAEYEETSLQ